MLIGTAIVLSLIVILLAMPVTLTYRYSWAETQSADVRLDWAFGLVHADVTPDLVNDETEAARRKAGWWRRSKDGKANVMVAIRLPAFRRRILRFVSDVWRAIHKKNVQLMVRLGLGDPADTGRLWAVLGPLSGMLASLRDVRITIEPDFIDATLDIDSSGTIRIVPLQLVAILIGLAFSPPVWRGIMLMRSSG